MPITAPVDGSGICTFRKSVYDEEGDTIYINAVEVVEVDGVPVTPSTPAWLSSGYTTTDEATTEGSLGARLYKHFDFAIDTNHASIEKNTSYKIRIRADDNLNPEQNLDFVYTNGILDFSTITGLTGYLAARLQGGGGTTLTNYGSGPDFSGESFAYNATLFDNRGGWVPTDDTQTAPGSGLFPIDNGNEPWSMFIVMLIPDKTSNRTFIEYYQSSGNGIRLYSQSSTLQAWVYNNGASSNYAAPFVSGVPMVVELHRDTSGNITYWINGVLQHTFTGALFPMPNIDMEFEHDGWTNSSYAEMLIVNAELSGGQKTQVRKALRAIYPSLVNLVP